VRHLAGKMPAAAAFSMPLASRVVVMLRNDLAEGRRAWIEALQTSAEQLEAEKGTFLAYRDDAGLVADFHSLRHSCGYWLLESGVDMRVVQRILRHSTITLTVDRYGKLRGMLGAKAQRAGVDKMPDMLPTREHQAMKATGTDNSTATAASLVSSLSPGLSLNGEIQCCSVESDGVNSDGASIGKTNENAPENQCFTGQERRERDSNPCYGYKPVERFSKPSPSAARPSLLIRRAGARQNTIRSTEKDKIDHPLPGALRATLLFDVWRGEEYIHPPCAFS